MINSPLNNPTSISHCLILNAAPNNETISRPIIATKIKSYDITDIIHYYLYYIHVLKLSKELTLFYKLAIC